MQEPRTPILKSSLEYQVRILRPLEYADLREHGALLPTYQAQMDGLLATGMRYVEAQRLQANQGWFDSKGFVYLPPTAMLKSLTPVSYVKDGKTKIRRQRSQLDRWVKLNPFGLRALPAFLKAKRLPGWETWSMHLKEWAERAGMDPRGLGPKTLRKTWESWLVCTYPGRLAEITMSQGHTAVTSVAHYLNMPFLAEEKEQMRPYVEGMF